MAESTSFSVTLCFFLYNCCTLITLDPCPCTFKVRDCQDFCTLKALIEKNIFISKNAIPILMHINDDSNDIECFKGRGSFSLLSISLRVKKDCRLITWVGGVCEFILKVLLFDFIGLWFFVYDIRSLMLCSIN